MCGRARLGALCGSVAGVVVGHDTPAGLAACGKKSFGVSPACFLTARSLEQIKNDVCYSNVPATLIGIRRELKEFEEAGERKEEG